MFKNYLGALRKQKTAVVETKELSAETYSLLLSISEKFLFGIDTLALGVHIYQTLHKMSLNDKFWASACLVLAGKAI